VGRAVCAELHDRLWPDTFVSETSLPHPVGELRGLLTGEGTSGGSHPGDPEMSSPKLDPMRQRPDGVM
jgi:hypothetical protein